MKVVVITGSTRGLGFGLADAFLKRHCAVVVSGRNRASVDQAVAALNAKHSGAQLAGYPCDIADSAQVQALWDAAKERFGRIDIWINNAGISHEQAQLWELPPARIRAVVETNLLGTLYNAQVVIREMLAQGHGQFYVMEGLGSDGSIMPGLSIYGTTKYAIRYISRVLLKDTRATPVQVGTLSPGMVVTDLLIGQYDPQSERWQRAKRIFNILADRVETVAPYLVRKILANRRTGAKIVWLTRRKILLRFLVARFRKRDLFAEAAPTASSA